MKKWQARGLAKKKDHDFWPKRSQLESTSGVGGDDGGGGERERRREGVGEEEGGGGRGRRREGSAVPSCRL